MVKYWILGSAAAFLALVLTPRVGALARWLGAVARPDPRRIHQGEIPQLGGLAILAAFLGALAIGALAQQFAVEIFWGQRWPWGWLLSGALVVVFCGALDDLWTLGPVSKLVCQIVAGAMVLAAGYGIQGVTNPFTGSTVHLGWVGSVVTLLWVVGITNAFNLIDGLDGLAAGVGLIASATLVVISLSTGHVEVALLATALGGALMGFLYYNFNPATVFLGDSGALLLGYMLSVLSIQAAQKGATTVVVLLPILALGLPIIDTMLAVARRLLGAFHVVRVDRERNEYRFLWLRSASIFRADRHHIHHRLLAMGLTHRRAVLLLYGVCLALGLFAFLAVSARGINTAILVAAIAIATYVGIRKLSYHEVQVLRRGTLLPLFELPVLNRRAFQAVLDAIAAAIAYVAAVLLAGGAPSPPGTHGHLVGSALLLVCAKVGVLTYLGTYEKTFRHTSAEDLVDLVRSLAIAEAGAVLVVALLYGLPPPAVAIVLLDFYLASSAIVGSRVAFPVLEILARGRTDSAARPVVIYGAGSAGAALLREIAQNPGLGYRVLGFIDDSHDLQGRRVNSLPVLGGGDDLEGILEEHDIREVIVSTPKVDAWRTSEIAVLCQRKGIPLRRFRIALEEVEEAIPAAPQDQGRVPPSYRSAVGK